MATDNSYVKIRIMKRSERLRVELSSTSTPDSEATPTIDDETTETPFLEEQPRPASPMYIVLDDDDDDDDAEESPVRLGRSSVIDRDKSPIRKNLSDSFVGTLFREGDHDVMVLGGDTDSTTDEFASQTLVLTDGMIWGGIDSSDEEVALCPVTRLRPPPGTIYVARHRPRRQVYSLSSTSTDSVGDMWRLLTGSQTPPTPMSTPESLSKSMSGLDGEPQGVLVPSYSPVSASQSPPSYLQPGTINLPPSGTVLSSSSEVGTWQPGYNMEQYMASIADDEVEEDERDD